MSKPEKEVVRKSLLIPANLLSKPLCRHTVEFSKVSVYYHLAPSDQKNPSLYSFDLTK